MEQRPEDIIKDEWKYLKESIITATEKCLPKKQKTKRKEWMTEEKLKIAGKEKMKKKRWRKI